MNDVLTRVAEQMPMPKLSPDQLWKQGRKVRRRRLAQDLTAALLAVVVLALLLWVPGESAPIAASPSALVLVPKSIAAPHFWERLHADSPNGPALATTTVARGSLTDNLLGTITTVVIGHDGSYRVRRDAQMPVLSPDGKYLAQQGVLTDLSTGQDTSVPAGWVRAWTRDSSALLISSNRELLWYDWRSGERKAFTTTAEVDEAVLSPDGKKLAYQARSESGARLKTVDMASGTTLLDLDLGLTMSLGGWLPDSSRIVVKRLNSVTRKVTLAEVSDDGTISPRPGEHDELIAIVGWRNGLPVVTAYESFERRLLRQVNSDGSTTNLLTAEAGVLQIPQDIIEKASFGGPSLEPPGFDPANWVYYSLAAVVLALLAAVLILRWITRLGHLGGKMAA
ncbi:PD40 domain-containing protein [Catelliglobosispora koreensis]|uniref:PD40 domain-containing protein n=1 Tax=Catelliglobosispora koreensis TaxID=129052 RepID=UPI00036B0132|nr:PD40 domain-containing protein [Catelliglobosispora koreensis]